MKSHVYVGIGSNVNDPIKNLHLALDKLADKTSFLRCSSFYKSSPVGFIYQPSFINAVCEVYTELNYWEFLKMLNGIEDEMGRVRTFKNAPRIIDLDIIIWSDVGVAVNTPTLTVPHPEMMNRTFVMNPILELTLGNRDFRLLGSNFINVCEESIQAEDLMKLY